MKTKNILGSILIWVIVLFSFCGNALLDKLGNTSSEVEYDSSMNTENYRVDVVVSEDCSYLVT